MPLAAQNQAALEELKEMVLQQQETINQMRADQKKFPKRGELKKSNQPRG